MTPWYGIPILFTSATSTITPTSSSMGAGWLVVRQATERPERAAPAFLPSTIGPDRENYRSGAAPASVVTTRNATRVAAKASPAYQARDSRVLMLSFPPGWVARESEPTQVFLLTKTVSVSRTKNSLGSDESHTCQPPRDPILRPSFAPART